MVWGHLKTWVGNDVSDYELLTTVLTEAGILGAVEAARLVE